jgi:hypothetical protein
MFPLSTTSGSLNEEVPLIIGFPFGCPSWWELLIGVCHEVEDIRKEKRGMMFA